MEDNSVSFIARNSTPSSTKTSEIFVASAAPPISEWQDELHEGVGSITDAEITGSSPAPNCRYGTRASTRRVVIACEGNPPVPVHFDRYYP
ncbi:LOW QUALITY PROTEIN: hypothetical protein QTO34_019521, partial [Cnephaeus nilssonii]